MLAILSPHYKRTDQQRAIGLLSDPVSFPGLAQLKRATEVVQLYTIPSFTPITSWTVYRVADGSHLVRRVRWDFAADYRIEAGEPTIYGADAQMEPTTISKLLSGLDSLQITPFNHPRSICITDGVAFGVRRSISFGHLVEICWHCDPSPGCETLADWYHRSVTDIDAQLPAHTDQLRLSAIRP